MSPQLLGMWISVYSGFLCYHYSPWLGGQQYLQSETYRYSRGDLTTTSPSRDMVPSLTVLLTCPRIRRMRTLLRTASVMTPFVVGDVSALGVHPQVTTISGIRGSIGMVMIERVRLLNNFCCKFPFLVFVTFIFFPSLV